MSGWLKLLPQSLKVRLWPWDLSELEFSPGSPSSSLRPKTSMWGHLETVCECEWFFLWWSWCVPAMNRQLAQGVMGETDPHKPKLTLLRFALLFSCKSSWRHPKFPWQNLPLLWCLMDSHPHVTTPRKNWVACSSGATADRDEEEDHQGDCISELEAERQEPKSQTSRYVREPNGPCGLDLSCQSGVVCGSRLTHNSLLCVRTSSLSCALTWLQS